MWTRPRRRSCPGAGRWRNCRRAAISAAAATDDQAAQVLVAFADRRILSYIWDTQRAQGAGAERQLDSAGPYIRRGLPVRRRRGEPLDRGEAQYRGRLRAGVRQAALRASRACACRSTRSIPAPSPRATSARLPSAARRSNDPGHWRDRLHRKPSPGKTFRAAASPRACLARPRRSRRGVFPRASKPSKAISSAGRGLEDALRGVDTVIHLAGVTKALRPERLLRRQHAATEKLARALQGAVDPPGARQFARGDRSEPTACARAEDAEPHPLTHYGKSKLEAEAHRPRAACPTP